MKITGSLVVCSLAATFTAVTLLVDPDPARKQVAAVPAAAGAQISVQDFAFSPLTVSPGATVTVANFDEFAHTVTATDGAFDTGDIDGSGAVTFVAPSAAGDYAFICTIHPTMAGLLTVTGA